MAEEELKQEQQVEEQPQQAPQGGVDYNKVSLTAFILVCVALAVCAAWWIGGIVAIILTLIARGKLADAAKADRQPFMVFYRITKIAWWIILILAIISTVAWFIAFIVMIVGVIAGAIAAASEGASAVALFLL